MSEMEPVPKPRTQQVRVLDVIWLTTAVAVVLAYARYLGGTAQTQAIVYFVLVLGFGLLFGLPSRKLTEALFWAAIACLMAFVAVAGGNLPNFGVVVGWGAIGAGCGALAGIRFPSRLWLGTLFSSLAAGLLMLATLKTMNQPITWLVQFDVLCAVVVGGLLWLFLHFLQWLEQQSHQPRILLASWLTLVFVIGNYLVPVIGGVSR